MPIQSGLGFAVAWNKPSGFIGRDALLRQKESGVDRRLTGFALDDPSKLLYHNEPIYRDGVLVGRITSGMYGDTIGTSLGLGYVGLANTKTDPELVNSGHYEIEIAGEKCRRRPR